MTQPLATHTLIEYHGCDAARLLHSSSVKKTLRDAVLVGGGKIVKMVFHNFAPYGVSGVVVITESHVTVHTWPEHHYAAVDIFSCSRKLDHSAIRRELQRAFAAQKVTRRSFGRGLMPTRRPRY
jgi:S-adenosylmethionine decarboxylase proenzyme